MIIFHADLDNTLIYSQKRAVWPEKIGVEVYQDRMISFMTPRSRDLMRKAVNSPDLLVVPTTTRTAEQYRRINFGGAAPQYALVCNGGILLKDGLEDELWYKRSLELTADCRRQLEFAEKCLGRDEHLSFEIRNVRSLFIFTKSERPELTAAELKHILDLSKVDVFCVGVKVYVMPKILNKGEAVRRFWEYLAGLKTPAGDGGGCWRTIAAGDSEFDLPMLELAVDALAPEELREVCPEGTLFPARGQVFSDFVLEFVLRAVDGVRENYSIREAGNGLGK